ncbi:hypothetical protein SLA2020_178860 [Shorea laevis]
MPIPRVVLSFSKRCPGPLLQRFRSSRQIHSRSYAKSSKKSNAKGEPNPVLQVEEQASQSGSSSRSYLVPAALLGIGGFATFLRYNGERRAIPKGSGQGNCSCSNAVAGPIIGGPFTLINTEDKIITEKNFLGNWVLLYFGYTSSPDVGPEQVNLMAKAIDILESKENLKILPVCVTIDPHRDTPVQLRTYLKEFDSRIVGLTGPDNAVRQMAQEYRVFFKKVEEEGGDYLVESSHNMYLMNPKMEVVRCFGIEYSAEELSKEISKEMKKIPS